jgi:ribosomal protein S14
MSFKKILKRDKKLRSLYCANEKRFLCYKYFLNIYSLSYIEKCWVNYLFINEFINKRIHLTMVRNRCIWSNKSRWVYRLVKVSRMSFKEGLYKGLFTGFRAKN